MSKQMLHHIDENIVLLIAIVLLSGISFAFVGPTTIQSTASTSVQTTQSTIATTVPTTMQSSLTTTLQTTGLTSMQTTVQTSTASSSISTTSFPCSSLPDITSRVACRVSLKFENELNYLPEECRFLNGSAQASCISLYQQTDPCFAMESDSARLVCAKNVLGISNLSIKQQITSCNNNSSCLSKLREAVFTLTKFRFYNLEYKAQGMLSYGANKTKIVNVIVALEAQKLAFNNAKSIDLRIQIINNVSSIWSQFTQDVIKAP